MKNVMIVIIFLFLACQKDSKKQFEGPEKEWGAEEVIVPDSVSSMKIPLKIIFFASGCDIFKRMEVKETENKTLNVIFFVYNPDYYNPAFSCPTSFFKRESEQIIEVNSKGSYTIVFNQGKLTKRVSV
jgi:hypothetical protein